MTVESMPQTPPTELKVFVAAYEVGRVAAATNDPQPVSSFYKEKPNLLRHLAGEI